MKQLLIMAVLLMTALQTQAVLKEKDLAQTLSILKLELDRSYHEQKINMQRYEQQSTAQHKQLIEYMKRSEQISLMLYSQKNDFTFDVAYACTEASQLYKSLNKTNIPYDKIRTRIVSEIARYDSLIASLKELPPAIELGKQTTATDSINQKILEDNRNVDSLHTKPFILNAAEQEDREACLIFAKALRSNLMKVLLAIDKDKLYYEMVAEKVSKLNAYSKQKYDDLRNSIFKDGGKNYFTLLAALPQQIQHAQRDYNDKYRSLGNSKNAKSEWRGPIVLAVSIFMLFYILIATILSNIIIRWIPLLIKKCVPKFFHKAEAKIFRGHLRFGDKRFKQRQTMFTLALGIFIFAIAIMVVNQFLYLNLFIMAAKLMIDFAWLFEAILISLLVRLNGKQYNKGIAIYLPFITMALIIIFFRIVLIPNNIVNLICPPILLGITIWQYFTVKRYKHALPLTDILYSTISLTVLIGACISSWVGYTLLAVQVIIWWTFLLAATQTITCCYDLMELYEKDVLSKNIVMDMTSMSEKKELCAARVNGLLFNRMRRGEFIQKTWLYDFVNKALVPIATIIAITASFFFAADIFDMREACWDVFKKLIVNEPKYIQLSLFKLVSVASLYFIFKYLNYALHSVYHLYRKKRAEERGGDFNETLAKNIIAIIIWGIYCVVLLVTLKVPQTGISVVVAGLATGMGFAMKDLLENFFYGISLMSGRLRIGDYIECDGIQGKVESITYQSTQIITLDGSVIAFLNTSLFNKNFKNLTRNHSYELIKIPVGVAYGTNISQVRDLLLDAIQPLCVELPDGRSIVDTEKNVAVLFSNFGDSSVDLLVSMWVLVDAKAQFTAKVKETIYQTLNENNIEIPFPQQDVYIRSIASNSGSSAIK